MKRRRSKKRSALSQFFYNLRYGLGAYALRVFILVLGRLPDRMVVSAATFWAWITHKLLWRYRIRMEENIASVSGQSRTQGNGMARLEELFARAL
jgi:hypothetical protein